MKRPTDLDSMLKDGYTRKMAISYLNKLKTEEGSPDFDPEYVKWAHERGCSAEFASVLGLNEENLRDYLSEYDFFKLWPHNGWSRIWVNDKLTLRYTLSKEDFARYLPKYYYYSTADGLRVLMDNPNKDPGIAAFGQALKQAGAFACKPCNGACAEGFFKLSYDGTFRINSQAVTAGEIADFVARHPNYIFTEYLRPAAEWAVYSPQIHTIRVVVLNEHGNDPRIIGNYARIPHKGAGEANYIRHDGTNNDQYNLNLLIDMETGEYGDAYAVSATGKKKITHHPDTGAPMWGTIPCIEELKRVSLDIALWFNNLTLIGFDFGITDRGIRIMEINTLPGPLFPQLWAPYNRDASTRRFFERKLSEIDSMTEAEKQVRNNIVR